MCFKEDNKNFINIKLHAEMKGLSDDEKLKKYRLENQEDTRKRLKESYIKCPKKLDFYSEAFDELSFFELDYLMLNLFFEKDANVLFTLLSSNSFSNLNFEDNESISYKFWNFMRTQSDIDTDTVSEFLKTELGLMLDISSNQWNFSDEKNIIIKNYGKWILELNETELNFNQTKFSYCLFCKFWNLNYVNKEKDGNKLKLAVLYKTLDEKFDELSEKNNFIDISQIVSDLKGFMTGLFITNIGFYPLIDDLNNPYYDELYYKYREYREAFNERIELSKDLCKSNLNETFDFIFYEMLGKNSTICKKNHNELIEKLNRLEIPNSREIDMIKKIEDNEYVQFVKQDFLRRLYIFEQL